MKTKEEINNILTDLVFEIAPAGHYELKEYANRIINLFFQQRQGIVEEIKDWEKFQYLNTEEIQMIDKIIKLININ